MIYLNTFYKEFHAFLSKIRLRNNYKVKRLDIEKILKGN